MVPQNLGTFSFNHAVPNWGGKKGGTFAGEAAQNNPNWGTSAGEVANNPNGEHLPGRWPKTIPIWEHLPGRRHKTIPMGNICRGGGLKHLNGEHLPGRWLKTIPMGNICGGGGTKQSQQRTSGREAAPNNPKGVLHLLQLSLGHSPLHFSR